MKITIKLLATYREYLPEGTTGNQIEINVAPNTSPQNILDMYSLPPLPESVILVNGKSPKLSQALVEGDEVCIFSAIAGGSNKQRS